MSYRTSLAFVVILSANSAGADEWYIPAADVARQAAEAYAKEYTERTGYLMPNGLAGINYKTHLCEQLAGMAGGLVELDDDFEQDLPDYPSASELKTDDLIYWYSTLDAWLVALVDAFEMTRSERDAYLETEC